MLKIKSNTNEFSIIFSEKIGKKINPEKFSVPALSFFQLQRHTFLPFSVLAFSSQRLSLFLLQRLFLLFFLSGRRAVSLFLLQRPFLLFFLSGQQVVSLFFQRLTFLFFRRVALFQPKCWAQNVFQLSPTHFFFFFSVLFLAHLFVISV